jgi:hypothetical protein
MESNKKKSIYAIVLFILVMVIGITGILSGVKRGETWLIVISCLSLAMITLAAVMNLLSYFKDKKHIGDI